MTVSAVDDDDIVAETPDVTLTAAGGDYATVTAKVDVTVAETAGLVVAPATLSVAEGASGTFTVRLATQPTARVTVAVASDDTDAATVDKAALTFTTINWATAQTVTVTGAQDDNATDETPDVTLTAAGGDYASLTAKVDVTLDDDETAALVLSADDLTVPEGEDGTFTVALASRPTAQVIVSVASSEEAAATVSPAALTFTTDDWDTAVTVTVSAVDDDDIVAETPDVTLTAAGGDYATVTAKVDVTVAETAGLVVAPAMLSVAEGASGTFTVRLATQPTARVTVAVASDDTDAATVDKAALTFTTINWATAQTVTVTGAQDDNATDETPDVTLTAAGGDYASLTAKVDVTLDDDETAALVLSADDLTVPEGEDGTFTVALASRPTAQVIVSVASSDESAATVSPAALTFTTDDWDTAVTVTVSAVDDDDIVAETPDVTLTAAGGDYATVTAKVDVTVAETAGLVVAPAMLSVAEGASGTFTVRLATQPTARVTVAVASDDTDAATVDKAALTFTTINWATAQTVTVTGAQDDNATDETPDVTLTAAGGDYASLTAKVDVTLDDDETAALVLSADDLTVPEGEDGTFTVALASRPTAQVIVSVASSDEAAATVSPAALTFTTDDWDTAVTVTVSAVDDDDIVAETPDVTLTAAGGDYATVTAKVDVTVAETAGLVVAPAMLSVAEGASGTFTVRLATQPTARVTVAVASDDTDAATVDKAALTFTTINWATAQTVTVTGAQDDNATDETPDVTLTAAGGDYASLTAKVDVTLDDDETAALVLSADDLTVPEGEDGTFTVALASRPTAQVIVSVASSDESAATVSPAALTFTTDDWDTAVTVTVSAVDDDDIVAETPDVTLTAAGGDYATVTAKVDVTVAETAGLVVAPAMLSVAEGASGTFTVRLATQPTARVTVAVASDDTDAATVDKAALTFTTINWATAQTVTVTGAQDDNATDETPDVTLTAAGGDYASLTAKVDVTLDDDETAALVLSADDLTVPEGEDGTFTVALASRPTAQVIVSVASSDESAATVSPAALTFTTDDWDTAVTVTVSAVDDDDIVAETPDVTLTAAGGDYATVTAKVDVTVAETAGLVVAPATLSVAEGASGTFTVRLATQPTARVTVAVVSDDTDAATVDKAALTFTTINWATAQTVTVTGAQDDNATDETPDVTLTAAGGDYASLTAKVDVTLDDDETAALVLSADDLTVPEGEDGTFTVALASRPTAQVIVSVASSDESAATVSPAALTFTTDDWDTAVTVTVSAVDDDDIVAETPDVTLTAAGGDYATVTAKVDVTVAETAGLVVAPAMLSVAEGASGTFTVRLATQPTARVTVAVASDDTDAATVDKAALTFTTINWATAQTVTVTGAQDDNATDETPDVTLTAAGGDYASLTAKVDVTLDDDETAALVLSADDLTVPEGEDGTFTVALASRPTAQVIVSVASSEEAAATVSPAALTFTTDDWDTAVTVTVSAVDDDDIVAETPDVTLTAAGGDYATVTAKVDVTVAETAGLVVAPAMLSVAEGASGTFTVRLATQPTARVTVAVASDDTDAATVDKAALTFTTINWATAQTVTVTGAQDDNATDETPDVTLTAAGGDYASLTAKVDVTLDDDETAALVLSADDLTVPEGEDGTFTVALASRPTAQVIVSVASSEEAAATVSPAALTFTTDDWDTAVTVTVSAVDDDDIVAETPDVTLTAAGGDYATVTAKVDVTVAETAGLVVAPAMLSVAEGASGTFTVRLATQPTARVTVAVASDDTDAATVDKAALTFTTINWATAQTVTVTGAQDDNATDETPDVTLTAAGGDYASLTAKVDVTLDDDETAALVLSADDLTVPEGEDGTFTVALASRPTAQVIVSVASSEEAAATVSPAALTFTTDDWDTAVTVTVSAVDDDDIVAETPDVTLTAAGGDYATVTAKVDVTVAETAGLVVAPAMLSVAEGASGTFTVRLATQPTARVTVAVASDDTDAATVDKAALTFTTINWATAQTVTVTGAQDDNATDETPDVTLTAAGGDYASLTAKVDVTLDDDETAALVLSADDLTVPEGEDGTFTVALASRPTAQVIVSVASSEEAAATVSPAALTFTTDDWDTAVTVTVSAVDDDDIVAETPDVTLTAAGGDYATVTAKVDVTVAETAGLVVAPAMLSVAEGASGTFTVRLATQPTARVTVAVASDDTDAATVDKAALTFTTTNWATAQTVTVTGAQDDNATDETPDVTLTAAGGDYASLTAKVDVTLDDDETAALVLSADDLTVPEGEDGTFTVALASRPTAQVIVSVASSEEAAATVSPAALTFTTDDWDTAVTVTVSAVDDDDIVAETPDVTLTAAGGDYATVTAKVDVTVAETAGLVVAPAMLSVAEGASGTFTVRLATQPTARVTVAVASDDTDAATVDKAALTFTTINWATAQTVTVTGAQDDNATDETPDVTLTAAGGDYASLTAKVDVTLDDDETAALVLSADDLTVPEGEDGTFTVALASRPTAQVIVSVASSEEAAATVSPAALTFTTDDWDTAVTVTVSAVDDDDIVAETPDVTLTAAGGDYATVTAKVDVTVAETAGLVVAPAMLSVAEGASGTFTVRLATQPTARVTVAVASDDTDAATVDKAALTFTTINWATAQTVTVTGAQDDNATDETPDVTLTAAGGDYASLTAKVDVTLDDDETAALVLSADDLTVPEGEDGTFTVALASRPTAQVIVSVASSEEAAATVSPAALTFTTDDWDTAVTVTVSAVDDDDIVAETPDVTLTAAGGDYATVTAKVDVTVAETAGLVVAPATLSVAEGASGTFTVRLATQPTARVTVAVASDDTDAATVDKAALTFTTDQLGDRADRDGHRRPGHRFQGRGGHGHRDVTLTVDRLRLQRR